jgi:hypothetical protein
VLPVYFNVYYKSLELKVLSMPPTRAMPKTLPTTCIWE